MSAKLSSLLLVLCLLACPFRCMGAFAGQGSIAAESPKSCSCCTHHCPTTDSDSDQSPNSDEGCSCSFCLCNGAVVSADDVSINELLDQNWMPSTFIHLFDVATRCTDNYFSYTTAKIQPTLSGVSARIIYCSIVV